MDPLFTTHDVARMLQVDPSTVSKWIDKQTLIAYRTPGGHRRVRRGDLLTFLRAHEMPIPAEVAGDELSLLVIDDDRQVLDALKRAFKPHGNRVSLTLTTSAIDGVLLTPELRPHGVLVDITMPDLDGFEVCRRIHAHKGLGGIKLVAMTASHTKATVEKALAAGALACLAKPVDPAELLNLFRVPLALSA